MFFDIMYLYSMNKPTLITLENVEFRRIMFFLGNSVSCQIYIRILGMPLSEQLHHTMLRVDIFISNPIMLKMDR